jgi:UPF0716 protein FxsA|tara:strand:- start:190 stop:630 length:441 start_codon:yes stop_codon:yes gene_type:complete
MNSLILIIIGLPILEIVVMIKVGQQIGALNTVLLIFLTAITGIYCARIEGMNTLKSGFVNIYKNKVPVYEIISGASIGIAAILLILPGFISDSIGFFLLLPFTRNILINNIIKKTYSKKENIVKGEVEDVVEAEIIEEKKDDKDEL